MKGTIEGTSLRVQRPVPSCPHSPAPHDHSVPVRDTASVNMAPQATLAMGALMEKGSSTGTKDMSSTMPLGLSAARSPLSFVNSPSCRSKFCPQQ